MHDAQKSALKVGVILVVRLYGIPAGKFAVEPGPIWFCRGLWVLPRTVLYWKCCRYSCVYPGEGARVSGFPWKSQKYSITLQCWSSEESQSYQRWAIIGLPANSMAFRWWPHVATLTVPPIKKVKVGPHAPHEYWGLTPTPLKAS